MENNITRIIPLGDGSSLITIVEKGLKNSFSTYNVTTNGGSPKLVAVGIDEVTIKDGVKQPPGGEPLYGGVRCTVFWFYNEWRVIPHKTTASLAEEAEVVIKGILEFDSLKKTTVYHFEYNGNITACVYKFEEPWVTQLGIPGPTIPTSAGERVQLAGWFHQGKAHYLHSHNMAKLELATLDNYWYYHYILKNGGGGANGELASRCFNAAQRTRLHILIDKIAAVTAVYQAAIDGSREDPDSAEAKWGLTGRAKSNIPWCIRRGNVIEYLLHGTENIGDQWSGDTLRERIQRLVMDIEAGDSNSQS